MRGAIAALLAPLSTRRSALAVQQLAQLLARLEVGDAFRRHLHLVAGLRVAPGARAAVADAEAAEASELDLLAILERVDDAVEHRVDDDLGVLLGQLRRPSHFLDQLGLGHAVLQRHRRHLPPLSSEWTPAGQRGPEARHSGQAAWSAASRSPDLL